MHLVTRNNLTVTFATTLFVVLVLSNASNVDGAKHKRKLNYCRIENVFECMIEPLSVFTSENNGTGIPANEERFENFCFNIHDVMLYCFKKYSKRCLSPVTEELFLETIVKSMRKSMDDFCDRDGELRSKFLRHSQCLINHVKLAAEYRRECVRPFQASLEWIQIQNQNKKISTFQYVKPLCCIYQTWENCIVGQLHDHCGEEGSTIIRDLIYHGSAFLVPQICSRDRYNPNSPNFECESHEYEADADFKPQGFMSNNIVSWIFSYSCPNIGWGIEPKRDY